MAFDLRDKWETATPRERRLMAGLAAVAGLCVLALIWRVVDSRLGALETKNHDSREALRMLDLHREALAAPRSGKAQLLAALERPAPQIATYLEAIAKEVGVQIAESTDRPPQVRGKYQERTTDVSMRGITLAELAELLRRVETNSQQVIAQRVSIAKSKFSAEDKLDRVELTIATFEKAKEKEKPKSSSDGGVEGGEDKSNGAGETEDGS